MARTATREQIEGTDSVSALRIIIGWPSKQAALDFMSDQEYKPHLEARTTGSESFHFLVEAKDDLA